MRLTKKKETYNSSEKQNKNVQRSLSSTGKEFYRPPNVQIRKNIMTPSLGSNRSGDSYDRDSGQNMMSIENNFCKYCQAPKDLEGKIIQIFEEISGFFHALNLAHNAWKACKTEKFSPKFVLRNEFPKESEIGIKVNEVFGLCKKNCEILAGLTNDIAVLAKVNPWKNASIRKPAASSICASVQETINKAQKHLTWLKSNSSVNIFETPSDPLSRCLQIELQQSLRERRVLEAKLLNIGNQSTENIVKTIERIVQEHQIELNT